MIYYSKCRHVPYFWIVDVNYIEFFRFRLSVNLQPSSITYNPKVFGNIKDFFILPQKSKYNLLATRGMKEKLQETFHSRFQELKEATKNELANIVGSAVKQQRNVG